MSTETPQGGELPEWMQVDGREGGCVLVALDLANQRADGTYPGVESPQFLTVQEAEEFGWAMLGGREEWARLQGLYAELVGWKKGADVEAREADRERAKNRGLRAKLTEAGAYSRAQMEVADAWAARATDERARADKAEHNDKLAMDAAENWAPNDTFSCPQEAIVSLAQQRDQWEANHQAMEELKDARTKRMLEYKADAKTITEECHRLELDNDALRLQLKEGK